MATQTSLSMTPPQSANPARKLWDSLTEPAVTVTGDNRRKASSLAALTLVFIPLGLMTVFATPLMTLLNGGEFTPPNIGSIAGLTIALVAYILSRTKYFDLGSYLIIAVPFIAVIGVGLTSETVISDIALFFLTLAVILSSLLLTSRDTLITGILASFAMVALHYMTREVDTPLSSAIVTYNILATGIMAVISRIREQNLAQLEATQKELSTRIVEAEQAREQAERSDQVKSAFLASMSHELRTPLNAVINFTKFVAQGDLGPVNETQSETLFEAVDSAKHLLNLINDVLDMSKIESGSLNLFVQDNIDLKAILEGAVSTGNSLIKDKAVEIRTHIAADLPTMRGDQQRIRQIMLNLISNACKFTQEGHIEVRAQSQNGEITIAFEDTGVGIAPEDQSLVFEAFKQTNSGLRQGGGTGLGMPISKNLAEVHGGKLWLESELGKGTTFFVVLPVQSKDLVPLAT